ncbi:sporulation protein [Nocardia huaxiensis]|uniref:Sporulation protein n=1 Tax=Nocardia huaxiensis TaxID=2755382 RepID=A0A7D6V7Z2_9NOCA|nr:sporulation protein [Nocardia huaxiensis]QLY29741.1 sporulation protein [Nocardia huaxiensis]
MFQRLLSAAGVGGVEVETELHSAAVRPGEPVQGVIRLRGGEIRQDIAEIAAEFVTRVEAGDELTVAHRFGHTRLHGLLALDAHQAYEFAFELYAPFETPLTTYDESPLPGMHVAVRAVLDIAGAVDADEGDPLHIEPLPAQYEILSGLENLGFHLHRAEVAEGWVRGLQMDLPFHQRIEFAPSPEFPALEELELTFVAGEDGVEVVLEIDERRGAVYGSLFVDHQEVGDADWVAELDGQLSALGG